ncbi:hypothetical protein GDO86_003250 [Hymenochirus boettgeri]|uniref:11-beta-hydroxysteroid dehydrogenase 1 n=1 Tax=Hymenochirus boettgeri TaxID=247094 RepID=A0A8T2K8R0_9PIPI|nr:hypothetical protein GDO86_003250 [Hymenochirus boettgeri]
MAIIKVIVAFTGICLAFYFYSGTDVFEDDMLKGKKVIVTGASSGIGEQMAYHVARMGSHVLVTARTVDKLEKVVAQCKQLGAASVHYIAGNMNNMTFAKQVVHEAEKIFGGLDMLILNHIGWTYFNYFDGNVDHIRDLLEINVLSYATMTVAALPMLKKSNGNIVVVSSIAGKVPSPLSVPYSTTKFALDGFFSSLRIEFVQQKIDVSITLCVISYIDTDSAVKSVSGVITQPPAPKKECALEIIKGGALRKREVYYLYRAAKIPLLIRDWAPEFLEYLTLKNYDVKNLPKKE